MNIRYPIYEGVYRILTFKRVYNIQGLLYVVTTNFGRERA